VVGRLEAPVVVAVALVSVVKDDNAFRPRDTLTPRANACFLAPDERQPNHLFGMPPGRIAEDRLRYCKRCC
jgi:hypothetical protein